MYKIFSNDIEYTEYVISMSSSISFFDNVIIGNAVSKQFTLSVDNSSKVFNNILDQDFILCDDDTQTGVFRVYEKPEKMTKDLELVFYDNVALTNIPYNSTLSYPTTIKNQLDEMSNIVDISIDYSSIPVDVLNLSVDWWDNTLSIRYHLMFIGELAGCNCFASPEGNIKFVSLSKENKFDLPETNGVEQFTTIEQFTISKVIYDIGVGVPFEYGDDTGSTYYLMSDNSYIETQEQVDTIASYIVGLSITTMEELKSPEIIGATVGDIIRYYDDEDTYYFMLMSIDIDYYNAEYNIMNASGKLETQAMESITNHIDNSVRIKRVQTKINQAEGKISILAQNIEYANQAIGELSISNEQIKASVSSVEKKIEDSISYRIVIESSNGFQLSEDIESTVLNARVLKGNSEIDVEGKYSYTWYYRYSTDKEYKELGTGKSIIVSASILDNAKVIVKVDDSITSAIYFIDENSNYLTDENGNRFVWSYENTVYFTNEIGNRFIDENNNYLIL